MLETYYEFLVNRAPIITVLAFFSMYGYTIYFKHKNKDASKRDRIFFSILTVALLPKFMAQLTLMLTVGAYMPFMAEVSNLLPVIYIIVLNEVFLRKYGEGNINIGHAKDLEKALDK
mgnify:FL=1